MKFAARFLTLVRRWALVSSVIPVVGVSGQTPAPDSTPRRSIVLFAEATARTVQFNAQPRVSVRLLGALDSIRVLDRTNLPSPVVAGRTYRDVHVAVEIFGRVTADCLQRLLGAATDTSRAGGDATCVRAGVRDSTQVRHPQDSLTKGLRSSP